VEKNIRGVMADKSMKTLKFRHQLVEEILTGRKTVTWRLFDDKDLKVGDKIELLYWETKEKFADAEIIEVREKNWKRSKRKILKDMKSLEAKKKC
jgi:hypothetical protein